MAGVVRTKLFAILLGTFGVGIISQIMNLNNLIVFASAVGLPLGLVKYISIWEKEDKWDEIRLIVGQLNTLLLALGFVALIGNLLFAKDISEFLLGDQSYYLLIIIVSISIPLSLINPIFEAILKGLKRFGHYVKISIVVSILTLLISLFLVYYYRIEGAVISVMLSAVLIATAYSIYFRKTKLLKFSQLISFNFHYSNNFRLIIKLGLASLSVGFADQLSQLIIRSEIIKTLGVNSNGLYQSIYAISLNYFSILFMSLGIYLLPVLSQIRETHLVNAEINSTLKLTFIVIVPLISIIFIFREYVIILLYSREFLPSTDLLFVNFLGDYFKAFSWIIGAWLIPISRVKAWVVFSLIYYLNFLVIFLVLLNYFGLGLKSVVISYFVSYVINSIINLYYIVKHNNFEFTNSNLQLLPLSFGFILVLMFISNYNLFIGYAIIVPSILLWLKVAVSKEDIRKVYILLKGRFYT